MIKVIAEEINQFQFMFKCPFCRNRKTLKKNTYTLIPKLHYHGSCGDLRNRIETRSPHCLNNHPNKEDFEIHITDDTKRTEI